MRYDTQKTLLHAKPIHKYRPPCNPHSRRLGFLLVKLSLTSSRAGSLPELLFITIIPPVFPTLYRINIGASISLLRSRKNIPPPTGLKLWMPLPPSFRPHGSRGISPGQHNPEPFRRPVTFPCFGRCDLPVPIIIPLHVQT